MTSPKPIFDDRMTFEEYLAQEDPLAGHHEFVDGRVYTLASPTNAHHTIAFNIATGLHAAARGTGCRVFHQGFTLRTPRDSAYVPDVMVACGRTLERDALYLTDPCVVVEVLSPGTRRVDTGEKLTAYQSIPSLEAYWIVHVEARGVTRHWRDSKGVWQADTVTGSADITVACFGASLTLDMLYEDADVPNDVPRPPLRRVYEGASAYSG